MTPARVFAYGTLRPGSWNHDRWLAPWLLEPTRQATLDHHELHHLDGLPYLVACAGAGTVVGDLAVVDPVALPVLDELEGVDAGHYERTAVHLGGAEAVTYTAGPLVAARLGLATLVAGGDWLALEVNR